MTILNSTGYDITKLQLREGVAVSKSDLFLKNYDKNNNCIFDKDELEKFYADLEEYAGNDYKLDKEESIKWYAQILGKSISAVRQKFATDNDVYNSIDMLLNTQAKEDCIKQIYDEVDRAEEIYIKAQGGYVSKGFNSIKELFNTEYSSDKVYRQIAAKKVSGMILEKANNNGGLSAKEYIQYKIELLNALLGTDKLSKEEQQEIESGIMQLNGKELDEYIYSLVNAENNNLPAIKNNLAKELQTKGKFAGEKGVGFIKHKPGTVGSLLYTAGDKKLSFEQIYKQETGVIFNPEAISKFNQTQKITQFVVAKYNQITPLAKDLHECSVLMDGLNKSGGSEREINIAYQKLSDCILNTLRTFYGNDTETINSFLEKNNAKVDGSGLNSKITFGAKGIDNFALVNLAKSINEKLDAELKFVMQNKTIEDFEKELEQAYKEAYGNKNSVDIANKFQESQQEGLAAIKMFGMLSGICLSLVGGQIMPIIGAAVGILSPTVIQGTEDITQKGGMTKEDAIEIAKELALAGVLVPTGAMEAKLAAQIGQKLLGCSKFMSWIGEYGSMAVMGALTDYAVMGDIDISQECIFNLINIVTGMVAHKRISKGKGSTPQQGLQTQTTIEHPLQSPKIKKADIKTYVERVCKEHPNIKADDIDKITEFLFNCKTSNKELYDEIVNSGLLNQIEKGKINSQILLDLANSKKVLSNDKSRLSKCFLEDIQLMEKGESYIKHFPENESLSVVEQQTKIGDIVEIGTQVYINENGNLTKINLTKAQCEMLFPQGERFNIRQNTHKSAGNCWYLSELNAIYQNPATRGKILKMFRAEGNDIFVSIPGSKFEYKFTDGELPKSQYNEKSQLSNSSKWVNMLEYVGGFARENTKAKLKSIEELILSKDPMLSIYENIWPEDLNDIITYTETGKPIFDINKYIKKSPNSNSVSRLYEGELSEAHALLFGKTGNEYHISSAKNEQDKENLKKIEQVLKNMEGKSNYLGTIGIIQHAYSIIEVKNGYVTLQNPYNCFLSITLSIDDLLKICKSFAYITF